MSERIRVGLVFGGRSVEHEVSLVSARGVNAALDRDRYEVVPLALTGGGRWLPPERSLAVLESADKRAETGSRAGAERMLVDPGRGGLLHFTKSGTVVPVSLDVMLSVVHGWGGEDGRMQGMLDWAGIPCVGAGHLGSAVGMDKAVAKVLAEAAGIPVGPWRLVTEAGFVENPRIRSREIAGELPFPLFVKPANGGSSVGITKARDLVSLEEALRVAFRYDRRVLVETALIAREIECAVMGNEQPEVSVPGEIEPSSDFYDYDAKYVNGTSRLLIPAPIDASIADEVRRLAAEVFRSLDLAGMARIDFLVERDSGRVFFSEANTLPGFTPISMYPKLWEASGVPYPKLLDRLIGLALERFRAESGRAHRIEV